MNLRWFSAFVFLLAQQGCTLYYEMTKEEIDKGMMPEEAAIRLTLNDSSIVESGPYRHTLIREPSDFILGTGSDRVSGMPFAGKVPRSEIDSTRQIRANGSGNNDATQLIVWRRQKASLLFDEYMYLDIKPEYQPGLWCVGTVTANEQTRSFSGRIDSSVMRRVETNRSANAEGSEFLDVFAPSLPTSGGRAKGQYRWANLGIGSLSTNRDRGAVLVSYSMLSKASLYSIRFTSTFPQIGTLGGGSGGPSFSVYELGAMYGIALKSQFFTASLSAGISYAGGSEQVPLPPGLGYTDVKFSTASFPFDLELSLTPTSAIGISLKYFSTSNSKKSWRGGALCLQWGNL